MISRTSAEFWNCFNRLPSSIQEMSRKQFARWNEDPSHPSVRFKQIRPGLWSARINLTYRALALKDGDVVTWFWIGKHDEYDRLLS